MSVTANNQADGVAVVLGVSGGAEAIAQVTALRDAMQSINGQAVAVKMDTAGLASAGADAKAAAAERQKQAERSRRHFAEHPESGQKIGAATKARFAKDPDLRRQAGDRLVTHNKAAWNDPERRAARVAAMKAFYEDHPEERSKVGERVRAYWAQRRAAKQQVAESTEACPEDREWPDVGEQLTLPI